VPGRRAPFLAAALAGLALLVPAVAGAFQLPRANVAVQVAPDGSLLVREELTENGFFHGMYRDIPLKRGESIDRIGVAEGATRYTRGGSTELGSIGAPATFNYETSSSRVRVVWHFDAAGETRTFTLTYRLRGAAKAYTDVVDVNLRVWGDQWDAPVEDLTASLRLPRSISFGPSYRVWGHPPWVRGVTREHPEGTTLRALDVPAHQWVELRTVFPRALLRSTAGARVVDRPGLTEILDEEHATKASYENDRRQLDDAKRHIARTLLFLFLIGVGPAALLILATYLVFGRERKTGYDREYEQAPPTETEPALVPPLLRQDRAAGSQEFTATLFDLIRRGRYTSAPVTTERSVWGGLRHEQVADLLLEVGDTSVQLARFEEPVADVIDSVLDADGERLSELRTRIEGDRTGNAKRFATFKARVETAIRGQGWYLDAGAGVLGGALAAFVVAAVILLWIGIDGWRSVTPRWGDVVVVALGGCAVANAALLLVALTRVRLWRRRTKAGETEAERWDAFRRYLTDFPRLQEAPPATLELWERYLVYGIAFGIAERVLQGAHLHMPRELHDRSSIYWITPMGGNLGSGPTALAISDLSAGFGSALTPPSSSRSGFGGGFSGGGGGGSGGGGGGGW
jgi:uncharacterized membrane protein